MRVLVVLPAFSQYGAIQMVENLVLGLKSYDITCEIMSYYGPSGTEIERNLLNEKVKIYYLHKRKGLDLRFIKKLYDVFKNERFDVIHSHQSALRYLFFISKFWTVPHKIHTIHSEAKSEDPSIISFLINLISFRRGVIPIGVSNAVAKSIENRYKISGVVAVLNGIRQKKVYLSKEKWREDNGINKNAKIFVMVSRLVEEKNHGFAIRLFSILSRANKDFLLLIVGDGPLERNIKNKIKEKKLAKNIIMTGFRSDVIDILNASDYFIMPSLREGAPIALLEAMLLSKISFVAKTGGISEIVTDCYNGFFIDNNDEDKAAEKISESIEKCKNLEIGENARQTILDKYNNIIMAEKYLNIYKMH